MKDRKYQSSVSPSSENIYEVIYFVFYTLIPTERLKGPLSIS